MDILANDADKIIFYSAFRIFKTVSDAFYSKLSGNIGLVAESVSASSKGKEAGTDTLPGQLQTTLFQLNSAMQE